MTYRAYFKNGIWDMLLCAFMGAAAATSVFSGFLITSDQADAYLRTFVLVLILEAFLYLAGYNKRTVLRGVLLFAAGIIVFLVFGLIRSGTSVFADDASNPFLYYILLFLCALGVFLLSRKRAGCFILYAAGAILIGFIEYLYSSNRIWCLLVFLTAGISMIIYRNYTGNVSQTKTKRFALKSIIAVSLIVCVLSAAAGSGVFFAVNAGINLPAKQIKIFTKHMSLEEIQQAGVTDYEIQQIPTATSDTPQEEDTEEASDQEDEIESIGQTLYEEKDDESVAVIRYPGKIPLPVVIVIIAAAAVAALYLIRRLRRRHWYKKLCGQDDLTQVTELYHFFLRDFGRLDLKKPPHETPEEYALRARQQLAFFDTEECGFGELTRIYVEAGYGHIRPDEEQMRKFHVFYAGFYERCRRLTGPVKYLFKMFRL